LVSSHRIGFTRIGRFLIHHSKAKMHSILLLLSGVWMTAAQFVPAPTDLIKRKGAAGVDIRYKAVPPEICGLDPNVKSFSGYADVAADQHIFWWFFEAKETPREKPLTIWINGGPGYANVSYYCNNFADQTNIEVLP
jgi:hypothetical protein